MKCRMLIGLLAAAVLLAFSVACSDGGAVSGSDAAPASDDKQLTDVRARIADDFDSLCGVVYLNYGLMDYAVYEHDIHTDAAFFDELIEASEYAKTYPFLADMPQERRAGYAGSNDLYLIIPADPKATVTVETLGWNEADGDLVKTGEQVYSQQDGAPFLLQCNVSDIFPQCELTVTDRDGITLVWRPSISMRDGTVFTTGENGRSAGDLTVYPEGTREED